MACRRDDQYIVEFAAVKQDLAVIRHQQWRLRNGFVDDHVDQLDKRARLLEKRMEELRAQSPIRLE